MQTKNKNILRYSFIILIIMYVFISGIVYIQFQSYAISENEKRLEDILMHEKALKKYIEDRVKPIIYNFQKKGILPNSYFNPTILSSTYISRHVMANYNELRKKYSLEPIIYKIASANPRNKINKATKKELEILEKFNKQKISNYKKIITINGEKYMYYALPVSKIKTSCLRCHSDPKYAPKDLIKLYGDKAAFHEKLGYIRGLLSIKLPLKQDIQNANHLFMIFATILFVIFILVYILIYFFIRKIDKVDEKLITQMNLDPLTNTYNRYKFNKDTIDSNFLLKQEESTFIIIFDIDHFKKINDTYGHPIGDKILKEVSQLIKNNIRPNDKLYRIGGEEFIIITTNISDEEAILLAEKLRKLIEEHKFTDGIHVTISIGLTKIKENEKIEISYKRVDDALYEAKKTGRNKIIKN